MDISADENEGQSCATPKQLTITLNWYKSNNGKSC